MPSDAVEPDIILPHAARRLQQRNRGYALFALLLFGLFLIYHNAVPLFVDWLWFREVGYTQVFVTTVIAKTQLFLLFSVLFLALFYGNVKVARRLAPPMVIGSVLERLTAGWGKRLLQVLDLVLLGMSLFVALWAGRIATDHWAEWLTLWHASSFHLADPVFHNDVGFYVFQLPFLNFVYQFLLGALLLSTLVAVGIHVAQRAIDTWAGLSDIPLGVRTQLLTLLALLALTQAFGTRLGVYDLLQSDNGLFTGAGYVDLRYRLLANWAQVLVLIATALGCLTTLRTRYFRAPVFGAAAWVAVSVLLGGVLPGSVQKFSVDPNQFGMERPYIERNIRYTRLAYNLKDVQQVDNFPADQSLTAAKLQANRDTLDNVRLWDYQYLGKVYEQLETIKPYYKFRNLGLNGQTGYNIDIDRYRIGGHLRQVMLAARELDSSALPESAQTWQNRRLSYTHGYGLVMSPVNRSLSGDPSFFVQGFPPASSAEASELKVSRPQIYYGMLAGDPIYVETQQPEFDFPSGGGGGQDHYSNFTGKGGIRIGDSIVRKLAFASTLGDTNLLLANNLKPQTRVLFRRDIRERLQMIAPFVQQDGDPYLVVNPDNGRLVWIIDCYTLSDRFPYATPHTMQVNPVVSETPNYIRNSVKATIDAYDGSLSLYLSDPSDPIAQTYAHIFPGILKPISTLPAGLAAHLRYPEDLFRIQRGIYGTYHVDDPRVFYLKEDVWAVPNEPNSDANTPNKQMEPYYVVMRLPDLKEGSMRGTSSILPVQHNHVSSAPADSASGVVQTGSSREEFLLMSPLSPVNKEDQNILGWMCARCDPEHYGQLVLYRFPQQASVLGPSQIVQRINSDKVISPQLSLLRSGGSAAALGNMLVIPVERSLLYVAPLYVEATGNANKLPKLQKVVVAYGDNVAMDDTLDRALAQLFPGYGPAGTPPAGGNTAAGDTTSATASAPYVGKVPNEVRTLIHQAATQYDGAQKKLKQGDFAGYGDAIRQMQQTLQALRKAADR